MSKIAANGAAPECVCERYNTLTALRLSMFTAPPFSLKPFLLLLSLAASLAAQSIAGNARRMALVIGNNDYLSADSRLVNSVRDAETMKSTLTGLGFTVHFAVNTPLRQLDETVSRFVSALQPGDAVVFFYSGHGIQLQDQNYLLPVDFQAKTSVDAKYNAYPVSRVLENLEGQGIGLQIVILDACRNNPFTKGWRGDSTRGLLPMNAGRGTYIAFATAPGGVASDNPGGRNGLFTEELVATLTQPGLSVDQIFNRVRARVRQRSENRQIPWSTTSVEGEFYFRPAAAAPPPPPTSARAGDAEFELELWRSVQSTNTAAAYAEYIRQYPNGRFAAIARIRQPPAEPSSSVPLPALRTDPPQSPKLNLRDGLKYAWIPAGTFSMGCSPGDSNCAADEKPAHDVTLTRGFWIGTTEVTRGAYRTVTGRRLGPPAEDSLPASGVAWDEATQYCTAIGLRLPTEAQWEYAARAGRPYAIYVQTDPFPRSSSPTDITLAHIAWFSANSQGVVHPVGEKFGNSFSLFDMLGNVWEWTADWYDPNYYRLRIETDPAGPALSPSGLRVIRGGSFLTAASVLRVSHRSALEPRSTSGANPRLRLSPFANSLRLVPIATSGIGFRCAGDLP